MPREECPRRFVWDSVKNLSLVPPSLSSTGPSSGTQKAVMSSSISRSVAGGEMCASRPTSPTQTPVLMGIELQSTRTEWSFSTSKGQHGPKSCSRWELRFDLNHHKRSKYSLQSHGESYRHPKPQGPNIAYSSESLCSCMFFLLWTP